MWAATLNRGGQKLNDVSTAEDGEALEVQRREWLRKLEAPRGRSVNGLPLAVWEPSQRMAKVVRDKGRDLTVLGHHADGFQWLRPEEVLCLFEDSLIALDILGVPADGPERGTATRPLSVQEAYHIIMGGATPLVDERTYTVFARLFRSNFVTRPRPLPDGGLATPPTGCAVPTSSVLPIALLNAYHRRNFSRRAAHDGSLQPIFVVAVYAVPGQLPPLSELARLRDACAPVPIRCACAWQHDILFFQPRWPQAQDRVHGPADAAASSAAAIAGLAADDGEEDEAGEGGHGGGHGGEEDEAGEATGDGALLIEHGEPSGHDAGPASLPPSPPWSRPPSPPPSPPAVASAGPLSGGFIISGEDEEEEDEEEAEEAPHSRPPPVTSATPSAATAEASPPVGAGAHRGLAPADHAAGPQPTTPEAPPPASATPGGGGALVEIERLQAQQRRLIEQQERLASFAAVPPGKPAGGTALPAGAVSADSEPAPAARVSPSEGKLQQQLRALGEQAAEALRLSYVTHARDPRTKLEAVAQSAARAASSVDQSATQSVQVSNDLRLLARSLMSIRDDDALGNNSSLFPRVGDV